MNEHLSRPHVLFILGAGASVPLGMPTTKQLSEMLCDKTPEGRAAAEILQSAAYRFRVSETDINIENFLEHLYELQLLLWLAQRSSLPQLLPDFTASSPMLDSASHTLRSVQRRVFQLLHDTCGDCSGKKVDALWRPILGAVTAHQTVTPIFTLNYDWSFEKLAIESMSRYNLVDGFELLGGSWDAERFANLVPNPHKTNIALFKLHGSTSWIPGGPVKSMGSFPPALEADDLPPYDFPPHEFEMIYPGHAQESWFGKESWKRINEMFEPWHEREPYKTLYEFFHDIVQDTQLIIVIGYAFGDDRINSEILEAVGANDRTEVLVIDPGTPFGTTHQAAPYHWMTWGNIDADWSRFNWVPGRFGEKETSRELIAAIQLAASKSLGTDRKS